MRERQLGRFRRAAETVVAAGAIAYALSGTAAADAEQKAEPVGITQMAQPPDLSHKPSPSERLVDRILTPEKQKVKPSESYTALAREDLRETGEKKVTNAEVNAAMHLIMGQTLDRNPSLLPENLDKGNTVYALSKPKTEITKALLNAKKLPSSTPQEVMRVKKALESLNQYDAMANTAEIRKHDIAVNRKFDEMIKKVKDSGQLLTWFKEFVNKDTAIVLQSEPPIQEPTPIPKSTVIFTPPQAPEERIDLKWPILAGVAGTAAAIGILEATVGVPRRRRYREDYVRFMDRRGYSVHKGYERKAGQLLTSILDGKLQSVLPGLGTLATEKMDARIAGLYTAMVSAINKGLSSRFTLVPTERSMQEFLSVVEKATSESLLFHGKDTKLLHELRDYYFYGRHLDREKDSQKLGEKLAKRLLKQEPQKN